MKETIVKINKTNSWLFEKTTFSQSHQEQKGDDSNQQN